MDGIEAVRQQFRALDSEVDEGEQLEIFAASFIVDEQVPSIFGKPSETYIEAEEAFYYSKSLDVNDLFKLVGKELDAWLNVCSPEGHINSNYGYLVFSEDNGYQLRHAVEELKVRPNSRRAIIHYTRPSMNVEYAEGGKNDYICTNQVAYTIRNGELIAVVNMRSNDAIYGFKSDVRWQQHVQQVIAKELNVKVGPLWWQCANLHIYPKDRRLIK